MKKTHFWKRCWKRKRRSKENIFDIVEPPVGWLFYYYMTRHSLLFLYTLFYFGKFKPVSLYNRGCMFYLFADNLNHHLLSLAIYLSVFRINSSTPIKSGHFFGWPYPIERIINSYSMTNLLRINIV